MTSIPASLAFGGTILRRQTTYWDLAAANGPERWRVRFDDKTEFHFEHGRFDNASIAASASTSRLAGECLTSPFKH